MSEENDIKRRYVDHLCTDLEKLPISEIIDFLARYIGWTKIKDYVDKKYEEAK